MAKKKHARKAAPAAQEVVQESAPVQRLPLPPGEKIILTDAEREFMEKAGWQEGDPIPDLSVFLTAVRSEQEAATAKLAASGTQPPTQTVVDFDGLSEEKQKEIMEAFNQAKTAQEEEPVVPAGAAPGVAEAIHAAHSINEGIEVVDDPSQNIDEDEDEDEDEESVTGVDISEPRTCPHCGWDYAEPGDNDKRLFLASVIGGTRFHKDVELFGGAVSVRYRTLTTEESDLALRQTSFDFRDGKVPDQGEVYRVYTNYRMAMAITSITTPSVVHDLPELADIEWDKPPEGEDEQTALPILEARLNDTVLSSESMRRVVGLEHQRFQRLVERLEARVDDPDFWKGTELHL